MNRKIDNCWLTVNKSCNLRCRWCYLKESWNDKENFDLELEHAYALVDMIDKLEVKSVTITGGEPTNYKELISVIKYIHKKGIRTSINTNGIRFAEDKYANEIFNAGLNSVNVSLKGYDEISYYINTGKHNFKDVLIALKNISKLNMNSVVSLVLHKDVVYNLLELLQLVCSYRVDFVYFSMNYSFDLKTINDNFVILKEFEKKYEEIDRLTKGNFAFNPVFPLCVMSHDFVFKLLRKKQFVLKCQLLNGNGVVFDNKADIIPCNALYDVVLGQYKVDFDDGGSLKDFINSKKVLDFYGKIKSLPSEKCVTCKMNYICMGGCLLQWQFYDLDYLLNLKENNDENRRIFK